MSNIKHSLPCAAYTGKEPFIFISYAHADGERVYPEIKALHTQGYRIWYDEGIGPSKRWLEEIAAAIDDSAIFMVFITRNAIQSDYVNKEVVYAMNERKLILPVYLEEASLPKGWRLGLGDIQAILKWQISDDDYARKMGRALPGVCLEKTEPVLEHAVTKESAPDLVIPDGFVYIRGGSFLMGSPEDEAERRNDETQHSVKVGSFYLAKFPVTVAQFEIFINETNYRTDADKDGGSYLWDGCKYDKRLGLNWRYDTRSELWKDTQHPVIHVSWNDAVEYGDWRSKKLNQAFRLPTEAEWEYACRAGTTTPFYTGANLTTDQANYDGNYPYQNNPKGKYIGQTTPVGKYSLNGWGLYDMHGNVWEWCLDWYGDKYYDECKQLGTVENPQGPAAGSGRVLRAGSWGDGARFCRSACRNYGNPARCYPYVGFRLVFVP